MHLDSSYPEKPPRLVCSTVADFPSLADGRDLLPAILSWNPEISFSEIAESIDRFLQTRILNEDVGKFHLLELMSLKEWEGKEGMDWFYCAEIDPLNYKICRDRFIAITHSYFLLLEPHPTHHEFGFVIFWASLHSIDAINKTKTGEDVIVFEWNEKLDKRYQVFKTARAKALIHLISENLGRLGSIVQNSYSLDIEEKLEKIKIYDILRKIERHERLLETFVDDEKINGLIALYQKAVEHFSAINDSRFEIYLNKLQNLFTDKRVLNIICSEIKIKPKPNRTRGRSMELQLPQDHYFDNKRKSMEFFSSFS